MKTGYLRSLGIVSLLLVGLLLNPVTAAYSVGEGAKNLLGQTHWQKQGESYSAILGEAAQEALPVSVGELATSGFQVKVARPKITTKEGVSKVEISGLETWDGQSGAPILPCKTLKLLVPHQEKLVGVKVTPGKKQAISGKYLVNHAQQPVPFSKMKEAKFTPADQAIYGADAVFPAVPCGDAMIQRKGGYTILILNLYPVEYAPLSKKLAYYPSMKVELLTTAEIPIVDKIKADAQGIITTPDPQIKEEIEELVDNPQALDSYPASPDMSSLANSEYVIITTEALKNANGAKKLQDIIAAKQARGLTAALVTLETDIYPNYTGKDNQDKIRNYIKDSYQNRGTRYVLLAGDKTAVPPRLFYVESYPGGYTANMPCDMYFGCLDGTFDSDNDGKYGEPHDGPGGTDVDLYAEVFVGRAPVSTSAEVNNFVHKTLSYASSTDAYLKQARMVGEYLGFGGPSQYATESMEEIRLGASTHGYTTVGFENSPYKDFFDTPTLYDAPGYSWPASELIGIMNQGVHILNHLGHANYTYDMKLSTSNLGSLTNTKYFFAYSQGCMPGGFDTNECFAEVLMTMEKGAFAAVMNARYGWGRYNSTDGPSQRFHRQMWDALFAENKENYGKMNQDSKEDNLWDINGECIRWCYYELNLFGDPEQKVYVGGGSGGPAAPSDLTATAVSATKVVLTWKDNANNEDGFKLERKDGENGNFTEIASLGANVTTHNDETNFTPGTTYYYRVKAHNASGSSDYSNIASIKPSDKPAAPTNLVATAVSHTQIDLTWKDNSSNEQGFKIERSTDGTNFSEIGSVAANVTTYSNTGLTPYTLYYYRVKAYNAAGSSDPSNVANAKTKLAPPESLAAKAVSDSQIDLTWLYTCGGTSCEFKLERALTENGPWTQIATLGSTVRSYSDKSLTANTTYYYRIKACVGTDCSNYSNIAHDTTGGNNLYTIDSLTPTEGRPGRILLIRGKLGAPNDSKKVLFGTTEAPIIFKSSRAILCWVPMLPAGDYAVKVKDNAGESNTKTFKILPLYTLTYLIPGEGKVASLTVLWGDFGSPVEPNKKVIFSGSGGTANAETVILFRRVIICKVPQLAAGEYSVKVKDDRGESNTKTYKVVAGTGLRLR